jgi:hypothetical protein
VEGQWHRSEVVGAGRAWGHVRGRRRGLPPERRARLAWTPWGARLVLPLGRARLAECRRVRVANLELDVRARDPEAVLRDGHRRPLSDDVTSNVNPCSAADVEPQARRFGECAGSAGREAGRLEDDQPGAHPARVRWQASEDAVVRRTEPLRKIDDEEVDRASGKQRAGQRESLDGIGGADDEQPLQLDATTHGLERVERAGEIEEGDDRTSGLRLRDPAQRECRLAARPIPADRRARFPRKPARS